VSTHHHPPDEGYGDSDGDPSPPESNHLHRNWFFYVAAFFILLAQIGFMLSTIPILEPSTLPPPSAPPSGGEK
jgi:hypothetical protein